MSTQEILDLLDELVSRLEGPAEYVFGLAVRATITGAVISLIGCLVVVTGFVLLARITTRKVRQGDDPIDLPHYIIPSIFVGVAALIAVFVALYQVNLLVNAEFYALKSLVPGL